MRGWMNKNMQDERFVVAEEAICQAFYQIAKKKALEKITVSDVIKTAGIVRSTFYNHYEGIPNLLEAVEDQTIDHLFTLLDQFHVKKHTPQDNSVIILQFYQNLCNYIQENPFLAQLLSSPHGDAFFEKTLTMFHQYVKGAANLTEPSRHSREEISFAIAYSIGGALGILHKWTKEKFATPTDTIAHLLADSFHAATLPYLN